MKANEKPHWPLPARIIKRFADVFVSVCLLLLLSPFFIIIALAVAMTIGFPIIFSQQRVGKNKRPFSIYKFRTMHTKAEQNGPQLALEEDDRVIGVGKILRKWRLDELPQFINVLKGDMSLVGPRPERAFYVNQLEERVPHYSSIFHVKPGITSKGMVRYGYASTVDEMTERSQYDIDYVNDLSLWNDCQILFETVQVVLEGSGK